MKASMTRKLANLCSRRLQEGHAIFLKMNLFDSFAELETNEHDKAEAASIVVDDPF